MKDPVEIRLPSGNRIPITPRMKESRDSVPPTLFDDLVLYVRDSPAVNNVVSGRTQNVYSRFHSRRQLIYCIAHGLGEVIQLLSIHSSVKGLADISTGQPKVDIILFIDHCVLALYEPGTSYGRREGSLPGPWREGWRRIQRPPLLVLCSRAPSRDSGRR